MNKNVVAGQAIYSKKVLSIYDLWVLGFSNHLLWKCPTRLISKQFADLVTDNHLDVGVGTGYYLKKNLVADHKRIALIDLNENSLESTSKAIRLLNAEIYCRNVLEPLSLDCKTFDSVSINYLMHCLPGSMSEKSIVFSHLKEVMSVGSVLFGSTILGKGTAKNMFAQKLMSIYNKKGIFCNAQDELGALEDGLNKYFINVNVTVVGCVALFSATKM
ncbi:MAG: class I SAM-dependent methyltransferase [Oceanospirillales bacterium]|nr:class I SAM-dependent methyltransferase [Oceanospirillales bacterium]